MHTKTDCTKFAFTGENRTSAPFPVPPDSTMNEANKGEKLSSWGKKRNALNLIFSVVVIIEKEQRIFFVK